MYSENLTIYNLSYDIYTTSCLRSLQPTPVYMDVNAITVLGFHMHA